MSEKSRHSQFQLISKCHFILSHFLFARTDIGLGRAISENVAAVFFFLSEIRCDSSSLFGGFSCHQFHIRAAIMVKFWDSIPDDLRDWVSRKIDDSKFCPSSHPLFLFMSKTFSPTFVGAGTASLLHGLGAPCREACQRFPKRAAVINFFHLRS